MAKNSNWNDMPFTATNYKLLLIGVAIVAVGFILMSGGGSGDPNVFDEGSVFHPRRITVAPIVTLAGYLFIVYAIMKRTGEEDAGK
ncbi:MAG: DUF3098 domain-containing protein [Flavobacteriales bacterium]|nr:DUF3098 domain-containing protein [Flavobacteriales bacterium]